MEENKFDQSEKEKENISQTNEIENLLKDISCKLYTYKLYCNEQGKLFPLSEKDLMNSDDNSEN
jgi:hypothetical protein